MKTLFSHLVPRMPLFAAATALSFCMSILAPQSAFAQYQMDQHALLDIPLIFSAQEAGESGKVSRTLIAPQTVFVPQYLAMAPSARVLGAQTASEAALATEAATISPAVTPTPTQRLKPKTTIVIGENTPSATPSPTTAPSSEPTVAPETIPVQNRAEFDQFFDQFGAEYGVDANVLRKIAQCESGMNPAAVSPNGLYHGLFQFVAGTWASNRRAMGLDPSASLMHDAQESIRTAAFKIGRDGVGAWPHCGRKATQVASA